MKLSIVIPVRNERDTVVPLIERVRAVDCGMPKELIVVDGASTDGTHAFDERHDGVALVADGDDDGELHRADSTLF